jgi:dihydropteroate synthase
LPHPPYERSVYIAPEQGGARVWLRQDDRVLRLSSDHAALRSWAASDAGLLAHVERLLTLSQPHHFAGLPLDRPLLMGILNVTPDSFSDGGLYHERDAAIARGRALAAAGADIVDIGGESTRPGAEPVPVEAEIARTIPVIEALARDAIKISIDTRHAAVMRAALAAGASIINDVTALAGDPESLAVAAASNAAIILMHMQGQPGDMQKDPVYRYAPIDIYDKLAEHIAACLTAGIRPERLCVDPGIGFGKTLEHNRQILADLDVLHGLGVPLLLGVSRKSFIAALSRQEPIDGRLPGSLAAALFGLRRGARILRVHDIAETAQAVALWRAIEDA